ncbi:tripartite tricarboxylate transporter TctB family protein [Devosia sp. A369]
MVKRGDLVTSVILVALSLYILTSSLGWSYFSQNGPGPGYFPFWYGLLLLLLAIVLGLRSVVGVRRDQAPNEAEDTSGAWRSLASCGALAVATLLIYVIGLMSSFALLALFLVRFIFGRSMKEAFVVALVGSAVLYLIFEVGLGMQLPVGIWGM